MKIDIGCGRSKRDGFVGVDMIDGEEVDIVHNLEEFPWPIEDNSANYIVLDNVIEHLEDTVKTMNELHRITKKDGKVKLIYPYWRSFGAYSDPTHVHFFNEKMIDYFLKDNSSDSHENEFSYYTNRHWRLVSKDLTSWPGFGWLPNKFLSFISRHFVDMVHSVHVVVTPVKKS